MYRRLGLSRAILLSLCVLAPAWSSAVARAEPEQVSQAFSIEADSALFDSSRGLMIYTGNVLARFEDIVLQGESMHAHEREGTLVLIVLRGMPAQFFIDDAQDSMVSTETGFIAAEAKTIRFDLQKRRAQLSGAAHARYGETEISGERIDYLARSRRFIAVGKRGDERRPVRVQMKK